MGRIATTQIKSEGSTDASGTIILVRGASFDSKHESEHVICVLSGVVNYLLVHGAREERMARI